MTKLYKIIIISLLLLGITLVYIIKQENKNISKLTMDINSYNMLVDNSFNFKETLKQGYPMLIQVGSEDCTSCKEMMPYLVNIAKKIEGKGYVLFLDYSKYPKIASSFKIQLTPTQFFYNKDGVLYKTHIGILSEGDIETIFIEMGVNHD